MKTYKYKSYDQYVKCQRAAYKKKIKNVWAKEENIKAIAQALKKRNPEFGICHGVRQGHEAKWFRKYLEGCIILGTDIGKPLHKNFIIQHDFNRQLQIWINKFDFLYSNSFDHAYRPENTFRVWVDQVKPGGIIILEYDRRQEHTGEISKSVNKTDPVSIRLDELILFTKKWSPRVQKVYAVDMPIITQEWRKAIFIEV